MDCRAIRSERNWTLVEIGGSAIFIICRGFLCVSLFSICKFGLIFFSLMIVMNKRFKNLSIVFRQE